MPRYDDVVARLFREQASAGGTQFVANPARPDEIATAERELGAPRTKPEPAESLRASAGQAGSSPSHSRDSRPQR